ncbi:MAG: RNA-binding protein [Candidatus Paceibacterota bacterium]|jgi:RNA recognition motif-containing protein
MYHVHNAQMRLYIGGLPYATTDAELREAFEKAGAVTNATVMRDKFTGRSRGFGFVEMSEEDGPKAIEMLNDKDFGGRTLQVNEARPMSEQRPPRHDFPRRDFHRREY